MKKIVICLFFSFLAFQMLAQTDREFWFVAPEVTTSHDDNRFYPEFNKSYRGGEPVFLRISTQNKPSTVIITQPANIAFDTIRFTIPANTLQSVNLTDLGLQAMVENQYGTNGLAKRGLHIESTELVTAYYEVFTKNNPEIFALKGRNALGTEFFTPFQTMSPNHRWDPPGGVRAYHSANIVATKDNTIVTITPTKNAQGGHLAGVPFSVTLQKGETYSLCPENFETAANIHMSGSKIVSNFPVAVTISDDSGQYPSNGCYDLMGDQIVPTSVIGTEYIAIRGQLTMGGRAAGYTGEHVFVMATQNATDVYFNGVWKATLNAGQSCNYEFQSSETLVYIKTSLPTYALHVSGFGCEMGHAILPPTNKCTGSTQVAFARSTTEGFFLNLLVRKNAYDGFLLNGVPLLTKLTDWTAIPGNPNWLAARINLTATVPNLKQSLIINTKDIFHLGIINGGTATGCRYGYFSDFNELKIDAITVKTNTGNIRVCYGEAVRLEAYGGTNFHWSPSDFMDDSLSQFPTVMPYSTTKYTVSVSGACNMIGTDEVTVEVAPRVKALFNLDTTTACSPHQFKLSNASTGVTDSYKWSFDDGSPSISSATATDLFHTFTNKTDSAVKHVITLVGKNQESCRDTMMRIVQLLPEITAGFNLSDTVKCSPLVPVFINLSSGARGDVPYSWEFGDGASSNDSLPKNHSFENKTKKDTTYTIRLITQNQFYCSDTAYKKVLVHPYIKADFQFTPDESCNPYTMTIKNTSVGVDSYKWTFGDGQTGVNSTATFTHLFNNATALTKFYTIQSAVANVQGCKDTAKRTVTIYPAIKAGFTASKSVGCDSLAIVFTNTSTGAASYKWDFGDGSTDISVSPSHVFRNMGGNSVTYRVKLSVFASNNICSDTTSLAITVHPYISASFTVNPSESCNPYNATINNTSIGVDTYSWTFGDTKTGNSSASNFTHLYNNTTTTAQTYALKLTASNNEGCVVSLTRNIKVYPTIVAAFSTNKSSGCDSVEIQCTNASVGASDYYWSFGDGSSDISKDPKHIFRNTTTTPKVFTIQLIARSSNLVCADTISSTITVNPYVKASFSFDPQSSCSPYNAQITNSSVNVKSYAWDYGDNLTSITNVVTHAHNYVNTTASTITRTLRLKVTSNEGCTDSMKKSVIIFPNVKSAFSLQGGCSPVVVNSFNNKSVNATIFEWAFGDGGTATIQNPQHTFKNISNTADVSYKISLKASATTGCFDIHDTTIIIKARPMASFDFGTTTGCSPYNFSINHKSVGQTGVDWNFGDGLAHSTANVASLSYQYSNTTRVDKNYTITLIANNSAGCKDTLSRTVTVYPAITSEFAIVGGCHPLKITDFKNTSVGALTYLWTIGTSTYGDQSPNITFKNFNNTKDTVITVSLKTTSRTGCTATSSQSITIHPKPLAQFSLGTSTGCAPYVQPIENSTVGATALAWDFGNGDPVSNTMAASFSHNYINNGRTTKNFPITLIAETAYGCADTMMRNAVVEPRVTAEFTVSSGCEPHLISNFNNISVGASFYNWTFGDGTSSPDKDPSHLFRNTNTIKDTTYRIKLITESSHGCKDSVDTVIAVYHKPTADFNITNPAGCSPWTVTVANQAIGSDSLSWNFGDGKTGQSKLAQFSYLYENKTGVNKAYDLTLIAVTNKGCRDTSIRQSTIYSAVIAKFAIQSGCHPLMLTNFNNTTIGGTFYNWDFGDGNSSNVQNPSHTFKNFSNTAQSTFTVKLTAQSNKGCVNTKDTTIAVYPQPLAKFALQNEIGCAPLLASISNQSVGADSIRWNYGDASPITINKTLKHTHLYNNISGKNINDTITMFVFNKNGCSDTISGYATVYSAVKAQFVAVSGCQPHTIASFKNTSSIFAKNNFWDFGDGVAVNTRDTSHLFKNFSNTTDVSYKIRLIAETKEACRDTVDTTIWVYHLPLAKFQLSDEVGCSPRLVKIANQTVGADSLAWEYGDASAITNSKQVSQQYMYVNSSGVTKNYTTTLRAFTNHACSDTASAQSSVWSSVKAQFLASSGCHPNVISSFKNTSWPNNITNWAWTYGDGTSSGAKDTAHTFNNFSNTVDQNYKIRLRVASPQGCRDSIDTVIVVYHRPKTDFSVDNAPGCSPYIVKFTNSTIGASSIAWQWGDTTKNEQSLSANLTHLYRWRATDMKNFEIKAISTTANGCRDSVTHVAGIYPDITAKFDVTGGCEPLVISDFKNTSIGVTKSYSWKFGDGSSTSDAKPSHVFKNYNSERDTTYKISLHTVSKYGCTADTSTIVTIFHKPDAEFTVLNSPGCSPYPIKIAHKSLGAVKYKWDFADNTVDSSASTSLTHTYTLFADDLKIYQINLITTSKDNCKDTVQRGATIYPSMSSEFNTVLEGCSPLNVIIRNTSFGANKFYWDLGDHTTTTLTTVDSVLHSYYNPSFTRDTSFTLSLKTTSKYGCTAFSDTIVTVFPNPKAGFIVTPTALCSPDTVTFKSETIGVSSMFWDFADNSIMIDSVNRTFKHRYSNSDSLFKIFAVRQIVSNKQGCFDSTRREVHVDPDITSAFDVKVSGCSPLEIVAKNNSIGVAKHEWNFGDKTMETKSTYGAVNHIYFNMSNTRDTSFVLSLKTTSRYGCTAFSDTVITVFANPRAGFTVLNSPICSPDSIVLLSNTIGIDSIYWDFADGLKSVDAVDKQFKHFYRNSGATDVIYKIQQIVKNAHLCSDTIVQDARINPDISSSFTVALAGCSPLKVYPTNNSIGAIRYEWNFGDGTIRYDKEPNYEYFNYDPIKIVVDTITLKTISQYGCTALSDTIINIYPNPTADFNVEISEDCSPFNVHITNKSIGGSLYSWTFDDGQKSAESNTDFVHTYRNISEKTISPLITLVASNPQKCSSQVERRVTVYPEVTAAFGGNFVGCEPLVVSFENKSLLSNTYVWSFGEGEPTALKDPIHTYLNDQIINKNYVVRLISKSQYGCLDTVEHTMTVYPSPNADFDVSPKKQVFPKATVGKASVLITDKTNYGVWTYNWEFGDGEVSSQVGHTSHDYLHWNESGKSYRILLKVTGENGCSDTISQTLIVTSPTPEPHFSISGDNGCPPYEVKFTNTSDYVNSVLWEFKDGSQSQELAPSHTFYKTGSYRVTMTANGDGGSASLDTIITIHQMPIADFSIASPRLYLPDDKLKTTNLSSYASTYLWNFGDGTTSDLYQPEHLYDKEGLYDLSLKVTTDKGCIDDTIIASAVTVEAPCQIIMPNAFTPNTASSSPDGRYATLEATNDLFFPGKIEKGINTYHLQVFNKWGELLWATDKKEIGWDGYYKGQLCPLDVYVWKLNATCLDGKKIEEAGDVTLIR